jgi:hypothetical protein
VFSLQGKDASKLAGNWLHLSKNILLFGDKVLQNFTLQIKNVAGNQKSLKLV